MCGICGEVGSPDGTLSETLAAMCDAMPYRGPDDAGYFLGEGAGLGHRRLSIIDPAGGHQPLEAEEGALQLVCNGEIYNFRELRAELEGEGARFRTGSDSEVLLHLYARLAGEGLEGAALARGLLEPLNGMFAFALWDARRRRLLLARDRMGQKPLFLHPRGAGLRFASELGPLLAAAPARPPVAPAAAWHFFKYGYIPAPLTLYEGIEKLPPATYLLWEDGQARRGTYWSLPPAGERAEGSEKELAGRFDALFDDAVRLRLVSDVPLGAFLSGGIDSALIAERMTRHASGGVRTFCIGFADPSYDERAPARRMARALGTDHTEEEVTPSLREVLPHLPTHFGEPFGDSSAVNVWYLSRMTRKHVTVALSGDGADEMLAGYRRYAGRRMNGWLLRLPRALRRGVAGPLLRRWPEPGGYYGGSVLKKARLLLEQAERIEDDPLELATLPFSPGMLASLLPGGGGGEDRIRLAAEEAGGADPVERMQRLDLRTYLPDDILAKVDRMSMAHALETRSPFLDHRLVELSCRLPMGLKLFHGRGKQVLRRLARQSLPPELLRRPKHGFSLPLDRWFREDFGREARERTAALDPHRFDHAVIDRLWEEHLARREDHAHRLWLLLVWSFFDS